MFSLRNAFRTERVIEFAPPFLPLPATAYGGTERIVSGICKSFQNAARLPFAFEVWAPGDSYRDIDESETPPLVPTAENALGLTDKPFEANVQIMKDLHRLQQLMEGNPHAVGHIHIEDAHFPVFGQTPSLAARTLTTLHNPVKDWYANYPYMPLVAISEAQKQTLDLKAFNFVKVVHNGIDADLYQPHYDLSPDSPVCFLGRFSPDKNPEDAVRIALAAGDAIKLAGPSDTQYPECHETVLRYQMDHPGQVEYVGSVTDEHDPGLGESSKNRFLGASKAMLFPIQWKEPFGLVVVEANACGTPVIAYNHPGSAVDELIEDGVNGFKVSTVEEAAEALRHIDRIDRRSVRAHFEKHFTAEVMAQRYRDILVRDLPAYRRDISRKFIFPAA